MHRLVFGYSFAELVAPILLLGLTLYFLNKKKASACGDADDADTGRYDSLTVLTETNSTGSSSSPTETNNSTSSSLTVSTGNCYEVFLSFRGPDTRKRFTDHLYHGLRDVGIRAFRDDDELCQGEDIKSELMAAITNSKILIPIFSKNYGTSSWCLDELVQIMKRKNNNGQIVLPIFYKVKPAEVRYQTGRFGEAFHKRESRLCERSSFDPTTLEKWKKALDEVSTLKGYEADGYEGKLVKSIVRKVLNELKKKFKLVISENLVGIDDHVKKIMEFVGNKSDDTLFVGIHGMGGIGKTTLAKAIYNKFSNDFEHRSFIADIRESWKRNGIHYLQNQLIYDILKLNNEVHNEDQGTKFISMFRDKKVLVLLDDVDDVVQLKSLVGNRDWFSSGSRIIITTRNKRILEQAGVDYNYEHKKMDKNQSLIMFSKHAFRRDSPPMEFEDLTHEVVSIAGGLPLSLEVFGSLLCGKESNQWRDTIKKLKRVPNRKVQEKLRISYEALDYRQKQIFLDIACFFIGTEKTIPFYMWDACDFFPGEGIEVLIFMSLIKVGSDHRFRMHDQLRDLGREIVSEENQLKPWCRSRLWDYEEVEKVLKESKGTDKIEAINLSEGSVGDGDIYTEKQFKNLTNLRYLHMIRVQISGDFKDLMKRLKWLQWQHCPANFEVNNFCVKELAVLELQYGDINEKWGGWSFFKMAKKLKYLDLSFCDSLENTDFLSAFEELEVLILQGCTELKRIDASIEDMELGSSHALHLADIEELESPQSLNTPFKLEVLKVSDCESIKMLDVSQFVHLRTLDVCHSPKLLEVRGLDKLMYLESLTIKSQNSIKRLDLPKFGCLKKLNVDGSDELFDGYNTLAEIQGLDRSEFLERLDIKYCVSIGRLDLPKFGRLKELEAIVCENLAEIEGLDRSRYLESLEIYWCTSIGRLDLPKFGMLKKLEAWHCKNLAEIQWLDSLEYLESLDISRCTSIGRLDLPKSGSMKTVNVRWCKKLAEIHGLDRLESLEILEISWCTSIERLLLPKSGSLKRLEARDCKNLVEIRGLDRLEFLEKLNIIGCKSLKTIPELSGTQIYRYYQITDGADYEPCPYCTDDSDEE